MSARVKNQGALKYAEHEAPSFDLTPLLLLHACSVSDVDLNFSHLEPSQSSIEKLPSSGVRPSALRSAFDGDDKKEYSQ